MKKLLSITTSLLFIVSCGGGGGGGSTPTPTTPTPTVNLSADPVSVLLQNTSTLTWSSTNATSCSASWTNQTGSSGSEAVTISTAGNNSFSITCTGAGGSRSATVTVEGYRNTDGVVVDGYISGAEVCIDEDESWTCDSSEPSTTSDNDGKFTIKYANGNLVSIGGTDLDSQTLLDNLLITHKLTGHSDFKAVTPVTSIAAFMTDASLVNVALGIDSSIDVSTFDPVANKGDGGINDYLYEKGNQLTVLAYALQNITNDLNTSTETTQDYFKAITEEIEKEYTETETKVDIETETFITKAIDNVIAAKSVTIDETAKANTTKALAGILPVIEVKSSDDLTTAVIRFAVSTLQTDIQAIANGTATAETVTSYTSDILAYIAEDQNVDSGEIAPDISAIADSATTSEDTAVTINVVANDSYVTTAPVSITTSNGTNGTTTIAESSPEQIVYTPDADYNGTDTFTYTLTQGEKTSSADVTLSIEAVNDAPSIDIASTIQVQENQTAVTTVSVSDVDEDELTLTLGGTDADSFNLSDENVLTFKEAPDYETKSSYVITLSLTDGTETVTKEVTISVTKINNVAPEFTSEAIFSAAENQTAIGTVTATDAEEDDVTFTVSGSELAITSAGVLTFVEAPDYETKATYTATVTASDGTNTTTQDITVNVINVNEEPVITNLTSTIGSEENQLNVFQVNAVDYEGDKIYYSLTGIDSEFFNIDSSGLITFKEAPDYETPLDNGADNLYSINIIVSDTEPSSINNLNIKPSYSTSRSIQTSNTSTEVSIINVDEDLIDLEFNTTDGTLSEAPSLSINLVIDELTKPSEVQVLTWLIGNTQTWYTASKVDSLNWSINESLDSTAASGTYEIRQVLIKRDGLDNLTIVDTALKEKGFDIDSVIYNASADATDPILTSIDSISVSGNDDDLSTDIIVTIVASVTDGEGEIDKVFSYIKSPGGETVGSWGTLNSDKTKVTFTFTLEPRAASGTYTIYDIRLYDVAGNQKFYSNSELVSEGFTNSWEISNTLSDNTAPNIIALSLTPSINTSDLNRKQITIDLTTDEQVTDINDIYIRLISPDNANIDQYIVDTGRLFTTTKDGNSYSHTISLPLEYPDGIYNISYIFLNDKALNNKRYEVSELNLLGFNTNVVFGSGNAHAPDISSSSTFTVNENQTAIGTVAASDADGDSVTFTVSGMELAITSAGVLTFASAPDYETKSSYSATITVSDGANSTTQDITVNVTDVTEAVAVDDSSSGIEDDNIRVDVLINDTFISSDVTLTATDGTNMSVEVQNDATSVAEYGHPTIIYSPDANWFGTDTFTYTVSSGGESDQGTVTVTVTSVNDAPTITSEATFSAAENQTDIGTVTATDIEDDILTYSISGSDISIDSSSGVMTFNSAPDYESTTSYSATVTVSDGTDSDTQDITINITNVVENSSPVFTSSSSFTVAENQTSAATITVTDADNDSISFLLSGTDAGSFAIASSGALTFNNAPDYETKESYSLIVSASDGTSSVSQTISINISNVNEVPQISALSSTHSPDENQTSIVTVSASDPDANTSLTYSLSGTDSSLFDISSSGVLTFKSAPDYETPGDADADNSYQINVIVSDGSLSVTQAITIQVQNVADLISGVAVDGYVAGATVFQDLNNDGDLDSGEPSAATNSLGSFSLNLSSVNINAPVRIYNGFDLASNEIHPSIMDISVSETGSYIVTPISTLVGRLKIQDTALSAMVPQSMIAGALGISLADSPNDSILGFDPIAYFNGSDTTLASEARPVFAASQLLMTMGGGNYSVHKYITDQALSALSSTLTTASGTSITLSSATDIIGLKQDAYDAIFNGYVDTALANNPPINNIQFKNNKAVMTDYVNGSSSSAVNYSLYGVHDGSTTLVADLIGAKLDYDNLKQILDNDGTGTPMDLNFELANIPAAGSGSTGVTLKLFMGADTTQASDEDYLQIALTANWESDGTNFTIKLPASSSITASFFDRSGTTLSITPTNQVEDIFTVTQDGPNRPATLSLRLSKLFNAFPSEVTGLSSFLDGAAEFTYLVEFDNFSIYDHLDNAFTKIQGTFGVNANPGITVFADDIYVHENATSKAISFYLSQAAASDVTLNYAIADASTASSSDYTLSAGTITIPAGSMSTMLSIPVTNDTTVEAQEEIRLTLSNVQNAVLGRGSVSAFITDGEEILTNSTQKAILADNIFKDSKASINAYIKNKLDTTTITISGTSYTYSQVLVNNSITTDVYAYLDSIIDDYEVMSETLNSTIMTKADAYIDSQLSSFASYTAFATGLTQLNSGIKGLDMSQIVGTNINSNGTFPSGQNATTLQTALDGKVDTLVTLAADTVADILGTDTNTNFPNANVIIGTDGDDTITGTSGSDLIASFGGTDTVNGLAGNDKILGGAGVDTLNGGDDNDHIYGYAGNDVLNGNADADKILGGKDNDTINGGAGDDDLRGEAGDDTITSGAGSDTISGGLGDDTIIIDAL